MKITETMTREERRAALQTMRDNHEHFFTIRANSNSPEETVAELIGRIGYKAARETIAEAVNACGTWDARISDTARAWAATIDTAADRDTLDTYCVMVHIIHPAHLDQIARAATAYDAEKPDCERVYDERRIRWNLLRAIARDAQGAALDACLLAHNAADRGKISNDQCRQINAIYDAWERGWCAEEAQQPAGKQYARVDDTDSTRSAIEALKWHRAGHDVIVSAPGKKPVYINGAAQKTEPREDENRAHCKHIAQELDAYVNGEIKRCPNCGEEHRRDWNDVGDAFKCPNCGDVASVDDWEWLGIYDFLADCYDIEYRVTSRRELRSVCVMVACGGPNIYIDTQTNDVELYWWSESARYPMSYDAAEAVDQWAEEMWECC